MGACASPGIRFQRKNRKGKSKNSNLSTYVHLITLLHTKLVFDFVILGSQR